MATTPAAPNDGHPSEGTATGFHPDLSGPHLRLVHAREIAPTRLDDEPASSPDEALGTEPAPKTPPAEPSLVARVEVARDEPVAAPPADASPPAADGSAPAPHPSDALANPYAATDGAQRTLAPKAPRLADALSVASQLSDDANAAAEALDNLKRMLEQPVSIPGPAPLPQLVSEQDKPRPAAPAAALPLPPPLPPPRAQPEPEPPRAPPPRPRPIPASALPAAMRDRVRLDVRGFFAGFALSWAIGAVLYLFMTVG
jgi:hypothetical protein